jgi:predicted amidohydrolase
MADRHTIRVAALQPELRWLRPMPNMHHLRETSERLARREGADLIVLPETFTGQPSDYDGGASGRQAREFLRTLARACGVAAVGGSIDYQDEDGARQNACFVVDAEGHEVGRYDKRVLFAREIESRRSGTAPGVFEVAGVRVGVLVCADLWDPLMALELRDRVDVLCVPAKTTVPSDRYVDYARGLWWNLALTRAMESALPVVVSDWAARRHESKRVVEGRTIRDTHFTSGGASICDPSGRPDLGRIQQTIVKGAPGVLTATIDLDAVAAFRDYRRSVGLLRDGGRDVS